MRLRFIHWLQDVPDQAAIVRQYCRYTGEVRTAHNIKQIVNRALQMATSDPKGPAYLTASREALEQVSRLGHLCSRVCTHGWKDSASGEYRSRKMGCNNTNCTPSVR